jgi:hypothetical protein
VTMVRLRDIDIQAELDRLTVLGARAADAS